MANKLKRPITRGIAKVPMVMQLEVLECGAASLSMILAYYDKWIPLEQVREICGVSRDGSNARSILKAARFYGLKALGYRYEPESLRENGKFPCIIHWNMNHFVVLDGFKGGEHGLRWRRRLLCLCTGQEVESVPGKREGRDRDEPLPLRELHRLPLSGTMLQGEGRFAERTENSKAI